MPVPFVMAHRGFSLDGLENSMAAFQAALDLGVRYLETDVHATTDGQLIAFHDHELDRVTDGTGVVAKLPWQVVRNAKIAGREPIPLLADVLGSFPEARLNIDVKAMSAVGPLLDVLAATDSYDRVCIASFSDDRRLAVLRRLPRSVASSAGTRRVAMFWAGLRMGRAGARLRARALRDVVCLQVPPRHGPMVVDEAFVAAAHAEGVQVHVFDVDDEPLMRRLLALGVDALITDRSDIATALLRTWS